MPPPHRGRQGARHHDRLSRGRRRRRRRRVHGAAGEGGRNEGRVYAVDIDDRILTNGCGRASNAKGLQNVEIIRGDVDNPKLPAGRHRRDARDARVSRDDRLQGHPAAVSRSAQTGRPPRHRGAVVAVAPRSAAVEPGARARDGAVVRQRRAAGGRLARDGASRSVFDPHGRHDEWLLVARPSAVPSAAASETRPGSPSAGCHRRRRSHAGHHAAR